MEYPSLDNPTAGAFRFNTDSSQLEIYDGNQWTGVLSSSPELRTGGGRGLSAGGNTPGQTDVIEYITIPTTGNSIDFGNLTSARQAIPGGTGSSTRGVIGGGQAGGAPTTLNIIDFITFSSTGNALDFGDLTTARRQPGATGSQTRGIFSGGEVAPTHTNIMDYVTIATLGNAIDFGDMVTATNWRQSSTSSQTRAIQIAGRTQGGSFVNTIEYVQFASLGNAQDFGDPNQNKMAGTATSNGHGGL